MTIEERARQVAELRELLNYLANSTDHMQSEDPCEGMVATEACNHCQLLLTAIPKLDAFAAATEDAVREALEEAAQVVDKAFEQSWVVQDTLDAIRALRAKAGEPCQERGKKG